MAKEEKTLHPEETLLPVELLQQMSGTSSAIHAGTCTLHGWLPGRRISLEDYRAGIKTFLGGRF